MADSLVVEVVAAVADADGADPADLDLVLQDHINTDALELLATHNGSSWTLSFELPEHEVAVSSDGEVDVKDLRQTA